MTQKTSPFLEAKYGWDYGESGWNIGADENWLKFSYLFDGNIDGIVDNLPLPAVPATAYYLNTDKRIYFAVDGTYYSTPLPKWFQFKLRSDGTTYLFNGTSVNTILSPANLQTQLDGKQPLITPGTTLQYFRGDKTFQTLNKAAVGLPNVDNTSDVNKPISLLAQNEIDALKERSGNNVIINGNFTLWQRGTTFVKPPHFTTTADRWVFGQSEGTAEFTVSQSTDVPNAQSQFSMNIEVTKANAAPSATHEAHIRYGLEGRQGLVKVANKIVTYSFWVKSNVVGIHSLVMVHPNADRSVEETYVAEFIINSLNTWEKKSITVDLATTTGGWSYIAANYGLKIRFTFYAGTTYRAQPNQWTTGNFVGSVNGVNLAATVGNYLRIAQFKLEASTRATPFEPEDIVDTLHHCQRYYYILGQFGDAFGVTGYAGAAGETAYAPFSFPTTMCKVPTVTTNALFQVANTAQPTFDLSPTGGTVKITAIAAGRMAARSGGAAVLFDAEF